MNESGPTRTLRRRLRGIRWLALAASVCTAVLVAAVPAGAVDSATFAAPVDYPTGVLPWEITAADLNGDGAADVVTSDSGDRQKGSVSVLLNKGGGTYGSPTTYPLETSPLATVVSDLNGDGAPDLIASRGEQREGQVGVVSVLLGDGSGAFGAPTDYSVGPNPQSMATSDLNGDGAQDLVVANWLGASVSVLLGNGDGTLRARTDYPTDRGPEGAVLADVNNDGKLDVLTSNFFHATISVLLGNGDGTFAPRADFDAGDTGNDLGVGDMNGDGNLDAVTSDFFVDTVSVLLGNGDGTFGAKTQFPTSTGPNKLKLADLNGDGALDVVTCSWFVGTVSMLPGNGDGTLATHADTVVGEAEPAVDVADVNRDGRPDLVTTDYNVSSVAVMLNTTGNHQPVAAADGYSTTRREALAVAAPGVLANDTDPDGDALTATVASGPTKGTLALSPDGSFLYTPDKKFIGTDTFTYTVSDGLATSAPATVTILVTR
jgi:hypothetical protein